MTSPSVTTSVITTAPLLNHPWHGTTKPTITMPLYNQTHHNSTDRRQSRRSPSPSQRLIGTQVERCPYCSGKDIIKKGKRRKKYETVQLWYCYHCERVFTPQVAKGKTYPLPVILHGLSLYHSGHTLTESTKRLKARYGFAIQPRTLSTWLAEYKTLTPYRRLRDRGMQRYTPRDIVRSVRLHHRQVYHYRTHQAKLDLILAEREHQAFKPIATFLTDMAGGCPHHLFQDGGRASQSKGAFNLDTVEIKERHNLASRIAMLALQTAPTRKLRHDTLQRFMLVNDSVTVAMEVPIYFTPEDLTLMQTDAGFTIPLASDTTLTGHIDLLQIRNGAIHILDYKPNAAKEKPIAQLMLYALALSRRTGLRLFDFTCAWFDEHDYFEFYPLHVVHKVRKRAQGR